MTHSSLASPFRRGGVRLFNPARGLARRLLLPVVTCLPLGLAAQSAAPYEFITVSGVAAKPGSANGAGGGANLPLFTRPMTLVMDGVGGIYVADTGNNLIRAVAPDGTVTTVAGTPGLTGSADGTGVDSGVSFNSPQGLARDGSGNLYVADYNGNTIRKVTPAGVVTTIAGTTTSGSTDGTGTAALFSKPAGLALDASGNLFVTDSANHTIRKVTPAGVVTTFAGTAGTAGSADGTGAAARFSSPRGLTADGFGNLYVADTGNNTIRMVTPAGVVTTLAGASGTFGSTDGTGVTARFSNPTGIALDAAGNVYVADQTNHLIRKVTPAGAVTTVAGTAGISGQVDGPAATARFSSPMGVVPDSAGNLYVADYNNHLIRKITPDGEVETIAGVGGASGFLDGNGHLLNAAFYSNPGGIAIAPGNTAYVADTGNNLIRRINEDGTVTTLAGSTNGTGVADGNGTAARFNAPGGLTADGAGNLYVADSANHTIRKITPGGDVTTFAGTRLIAGSADGQGTAATFAYPSGVAADSGGNLYVADYENHAIRKITQTGIVSTLAGSPGTPGSADGMGTTARFNYPRGVAVDGAGTLYIADYGNHTVRRVTAAGFVSTLAGMLGASGSADGTGSAARFNGPSSVVVDGAGMVYVADANNSILRAVTPAGVVTTIGGLSGSVGSVDGTGTAARFNHPNGVALDAIGNLYVTDNRNHTIRLGLASGNTSGIGLDAADDGDSGSGGNPGGGDPGGGTPPGQTFITRPTGMAAGPAAGGYLVVDNASHSLKAVAADGTVTVFAGKEGSAGSADGTGTAALFSSPTAIVSDFSGNYYVTDTGNATVRKITSTGVVTTLAGSAGNRGSQNGAGSAARFDSPAGIAYDSTSASLYVVDSGNSTIRKILVSDGTVTTYAGRDRTVGGTDGSSTNALFNNPVGLAIDTASNLYLADTGNHTVRMIRTKPRVVTITADGSVTADGNARVVLTDAALAGSPLSLSVAVTNGDTASTWAPKIVTALNANTAITARYTASSSGAIVALSYLATVDDSGAVAITLDNDTSTGITPTTANTVSSPAGTVTTLAGSVGVSGVFDGSGSFALFNQPRGIISDSAGNVYVADTGNSSIRMISSRRTVSTLAGISGLSGFRDGAGSAALFNKPEGVFVDASLRVLDTGNSRIRTVILGTAQVSTMALMAPSDDGDDSDDSSGGGGAPSLWFLTALAALGAARHIRQRRG